jgi:hypothetical protein
MREDTVIKHDINFCKAVQDSKNRFEHNQYECIWEDMYILLMLVRKKSSCERITVNMHLTNVKDMISYLTIAS